MTIKTIKRSLILRIFKPFYLRYVFVVLDIFCYVFEKWRNFIFSFWKILVVFMSMIRRQNLEKSTFSWKLRRKLRISLNWTVQKIKTKWPKKMKSFMHENWTVLGLKWLLTYLDSHPLFDLDLVNSDVGDNVILVWCINNDEELKVSVVESICWRIFFIMLLIF